MNAAAAKEPTARDLAGTNRLRVAGDDLEAEQLAALRELPGTFLRCRSDGHAWETTRGYGVVEITRDGTEHHHVNWGWRARTCRDCGATAERHYSPTFRPLGGTRAEYPDGYLTKGLGRIPPSIARRVLWEREAGPQPEGAE